MGSTFVGSMAHDHRSTVSRVQNVKSSVLTVNFLCRVVFYVLDACPPTALRSHQQTTNPNNPNPPSQPQTEPTIHSPPHHKPPLPHPPFHLLVDPLRRHRRGDPHHLPLPLKVLHNRHARLHKRLEALPNTLRIIVRPPRRLAPVQQPRLQHVLGTVEEQAEGRRAYARLEFQRLVHFAREACPVGVDGQRPFSPEKRNETKRGEEKAQTYRRLETSPPFYPRSHPQP